MQIGTKFSIAIHILLCVEVFKGEYKVTSDFIAASANTNAAIIRKFMGLLNKAGLIEIARGKGGGITLTKPPEQITLYDVYCAIEPVENDSLFKIHKNSSIQCPVGKNIIALLNPYFQKAQHAMENNLTQFTLQNLLDDLTALRSSPAIRGGRQ